MSPGVGVPPGVGGCVLAVGDWIAAGSNVLVGLSAAAAAFLAYRGLSTWRAELKGKSEYQLAKDVLKSVYKVREAFKYVRHAAIYAYEYPEEMRDHHGGLMREHNYEGTKHVYEKRWERMVEAFNELEDHHLLAQVEWGSEFQDKIVKLRNCRVELLIAIEDLLEGKRDPQVARERDREETAKQRAVLYQMGAGSRHDTFTPQIDEAVKEFENWLRPHVKR